MSSDIDVVSNLNAELIERSSTYAPEHLPGVLAAVVADVVGVDAASLSLLSLDLRVPLGASDANAMTAELLQFTLGEGPCLRALSEGDAIAYDLGQLQTHWSAFTRDLIVGTPFRSVTSVPLPFSGEGDGGALDLYERHSHASHGLSDTELELAAVWVVDQLIGSVSALRLGGSDDTSKIPWLQSTDTRRRMQVWVAMGMMIVQLDVASARALELLRAWAASRRTDLDTVAAEILAGDLDLELLRP